MLVISDINILKKKLIIMLIIRIKDVDIELVVKLRFILDGSK